MLDSSAGTNIFDDDPFVPWRCGGISEDGLTDDLLAGVAKDAAGGVVPTSDDSVEVFGDDCVVGGLDDGREFGKMLGSLFGVRGKLAVAVSIRPIISVCGIISLLVVDQKPVRQFVVQTSYRASSLYALAGTEDP